jgi:hypothetical protein
MALSRLLNAVFETKKKPLRLVPKAPVQGHSLAPHLDWQSVADDFLWRFQNDFTQRDRTRGVFHPSNQLHPTSGACRRQIMFDLLYAPMSNGSIPSSLGRVLQNGTDRHGGLQKLFSDMAHAGWAGIVKADHEVFLQHPVLPLSGKADTILTTNHGHRYLFDYKTISPKKFDQLYSPEYGHVLQLTTYMGMAQVKTGYLIYERKSDQKWAGPMDRFRVEFDPVLYAEIEQFCCDILAEMRDEQIPAFHEPTCKSNITFCFYQSICKQHQLGQVDFIDIDQRAPSVRRRHLEVFP